LSSKATTRTASLTSKRATTTKTMQLVIRLRLKCRYADLQPKPLKSGGDNWSNQCYNHCMDKITDRLPRIIVQHEDSVHVLDARTLRAVRDGQYLGDAVEMSQVLAVAILERLNGGY